MWCVDDTLVLVKEKDVKLIHERLNSFDENIKFTIDNCPDGNVHFLDIQIDKNHASIYYKPAHTRQYTHFHSQVPWPIKTAWVKALYHRAKRICSTNVAFINKLKTSKNLCPGIHTLNKYVTPYWKDWTQAWTRQENKLLMIVIKFG